MAVTHRLQQYALLMRINKPIGTLLLLWPTLWALWIAAEGVPDPLILFVFVAGVFLMRSAGCVINDYADRDVDPHVKRTKNRPLAQRQVSSKEALILSLVLALSAFFLVLLMNQLTIILSFIAVILAATYPFMKRYTYLPQVHLGAAFGWAIPMAFAAQTQEIPTIAWLLFVVTVVWTTAYDSMYAMVDREDDIKIGVKSTAILFGESDRVIIGVLQFTMLLGWFAIGSQLSMTWPFYVALLVASSLSIYQQILIKERDEQLYFSAFLNNNWLGMAIFIGIALHYAL